MKDLGDTFSISLSTTVGIILHCACGTIQYIPRNMHTVFALLCFVVVIHWLIFPYPSGLLHWHCGNLTIAPVPAKQPWWIWINTSIEFIMNDCITTTKQSTTKPCAYLLGYTVCQTQPSKLIPTAHPNISYINCKAIKSNGFQAYCISVLSKYNSFPSRVYKGVANVGCPLSQIHDRVIS